MDLGFFALVVRPRRSLIYLTGNCTTTRKATHRKTHVCREPRIVMPMTPGKRPGNQAHVNGYMSRVSAHKPPGIGHFHAFFAS